MKKLTLVILALVIAMFTAKADAQSADWEVVLHAYATHELLILTPDGVRETIALPEELPTNLELSPDRRYIAFESPDSTYEYVSASYIQVYDLETNTCCRTVIHNEAPPEGLVNPYFRVNAFNPEDSSQLLLTYSATASEESDEQSSWGNIGLMILNVETLEIVAVKPIVHYVLDISTVRWLPQGILWDSLWIQPPGGAGKLFILSKPSIWKPGISDKEVVNYPILHTNNGRMRMGEWLDLTGEYILRSYEDVYPVDPDFDMFAPVLHYQPAQAEIHAPPQRIFANLPGSNYPDNLNNSFEQARWVADGNAIFMRFRDERGDSLENATLLLRDGSTMEVDFPIWQHFLTGTPDGWLSYDNFQMFTPDDKLHIHHYQLNGDTVTVSSLIEYERQGINFFGFDILQSTPLGATASPEPFPTVPLPVSRG